MTPHFPLKCMYLFNSFSLYIYEDFINIIKFIHNFCIVKLYMIKFLIIMFYTI